MPPEVVTLHRYFIWANQMRANADEVLPLLAGPTALESEGFIKWFAYLSYWYGGLYVLIGGWVELSLADPTVDALLQRADLVGLLKRYRNGSFHFQKQYFDDRFTAFMQEQDSVPWVRELNLAFGEYFLRRIREERTPTAHAS